MLANPFNLRYIFAGLAGIVLFFFAFLRPQVPLTTSVSTSHAQQPYRFPTKYIPPAPVGVVTMQYGDQNELFERSIQSHVRHAERYGYPVFILRNQVYDGIWSKLAYMMSIVIQELAKDPGTRLKWLMWFDADSILMNPAIPLDIFVPPKEWDDIHVMAARDQNDFNAGVFFVRVSEWTVKLMLEALAMPIYMPTREIGYAEQGALWYMFQEEKIRPHVLYFSKYWFNAYAWDHVFEGHKGDLIVHFAGLRGDDRWDHITEYLNIIEGPEQAKWELPLNETRYANEVTEFWQVVREARKALEHCKWLMPQLKEIPETLKEATTKLEKSIWLETDHLDLVREASVKAWQIANSVDKEENKKHD